MRLHIPNLHPALDDDTHSLVNAYILIEKNFVYKDSFMNDIMYNKIAIA